jgi:hypothetical protein
MVMESSGGTAGFISREPGNTIFYATIPKSGMAEHRGTRSLERSR